MSRPKPQVLIEITNKQTYKTEQVLASEGVWAVFYDNKPINLKTSNMLTQYPGPKYKKSVIFQSWPCQESSSQTQHTVSNHKVFSSAPDCWR